jgi:hypothetical protein
MMSRFTIQGICSETCLSWTPNKLESCINWTLNKVQIYEIFVNLTCINQTPVYSEHKSWSQVVRLSQVLL